MRPPEDDEPQSWWIASTAIPLVAAAAGPLANVMSIVALVMPWRSHITSRTTSPAGNWYQEGYADPHWYVLNLSGSFWSLLTIYIAGSRL
jgi:potassium channel subfamily K